MTRSHGYLAAGAVLALGAPLGLLAARGVESGRLPSFLWAAEDMASLPVTYAYVMLGTMALLAALGYALGRQFDRVRLLSITDPLTGVFNRRHFGERLVGEMRRVHRYGHDACLLSLDVDHLKTINDRFGHRAGDKELVAVCGILARSVRATDVVARVGGDEFAVLLPETSVAQAAALSVRILGEVALQGKRTPSGALGVSIGIAEMSADELLEPHQILAVADAALCRAKDAGGGRATIADRPSRAGGGALDADRPFDDDANPEVGGEA